MTELRTTLDLAFLSATPALAPARSPVAGAAARCGGRLGRREGWELAVAFAGPDAEARAIRETVALADAAPLSVLELSRGDGAEAADVAGERDGTWLCPVGAGRLLAVGPGEAAMAGEALDVSGAYAGLRLLGPLAREAIARFCALDLRPAHAPVGAVRPGSIARTPGLVLREGEDRYLLLVGSAYAEYVWDVVHDAVVRLDGRPVGFDVVADA